jgi:hypothetical protein
MPGFGVAPVQWFEAAIQISSSSLFIPCYQGATLMMPVNWQAPQIMGNRWIFNKVQGLTQPLIEMNLALRDKSNEALSLTFLNYFMTRSNDVSFNTGYIPGGITFWDGVDSWLIENAKAESFTLQVSKGELISMTVRFVATTMVSTSPLVNTSMDDTNLLNFANCDFPTPSAYEGEVWTFSSSFTNNHRPKLALDMTRFPNAQNAGSPAAGAQIRVQGNFGIPPDGQAMPFTIQGANVTRVFTITNPFCQNPDDRNTAAPEIMRNYSFLCTGADARTTGPMVIT